MTHHLTIAIDPGIGGALAAVADGVPVKLVDMPIVSRETKAKTPAGNPKKSNEVSPIDLALMVRSILSQHPGAFVFGVIEESHPFAGKKKPGEAQRSMGAASAKSQGDSFGVARAVLGTLRIPVVRVSSIKWKRHHDLIGAKKDDSRLMAIELFPNVANQLARKKDVDRAEALLMALWAEQTEQASQVA